MGARFAKWRAVIAIGPDLPSRGCIDANAQALARYAALCQEEGLVPIVEPEVLMDGEHTLERCREVTEEALHAVFNQLYDAALHLGAQVVRVERDGKEWAVDQIQWMIMKVRGPIPQENATNLGRAKG